MKNIIPAKNILTTVLVASVITLSPAAFAKDKYDKHSPALTDWATVTNVEPVTRTIEQRKPYEDCWYEEVRYEAPSSSNVQSPTGTILGGIIGGAIGNAVGHKKKNKQVGTAVGAILGASLGYDISRQVAGNDSRSEHRDSYRKEQRCETRYETSYREEVIGYDVWYRYHGERFHTRMNQDPGKKIRVRVTVEPM